MAERVARKNGKNPQDTRGRMVQGRQEATRGQGDGRKPKVTEWQPPA